jgi:hypothetical protein
VLTGAANQRREDLAPAWYAATDRVSAVASDALSSVQGQISAWRGDASRDASAVTGAPPATTATQTQPAAPVPSPASPTAAPPVADPTGPATATVSDVPAVSEDSEAQTPLISAVPAAGGADAAAAPAVTAQVDAGAESPPATTATSAAPTGGPGRLSFTTGNLPISESATTARLLVRRSGGSAGTVSFEWRTVDDSAQAGVDYAGMSPRRETLRPGQTSVELLIPLVGVSVRDSTKLFDVVFDDCTGGARAVSITRATVVFVDDD